MIITEQLEDEICTQGFHIIDNFLPLEDYQTLRAIADEMHTKGQFKSAKIGRQLGAGHHSAIRNDKICWLNEESANQSIKAYFHQINLLADRLNQTLFLGLVDFETHFAIYQPGALYKKHVDQFATTKERRISCVYYLNTDWQESFAGELTLYGLDDQLITSILPCGNRFVCFSSELPHEVCPTRQTRYSITGWMKTRSMSLIT